jgi:trehalose 6-phosphate phosphatase
LKYIFRNLDEIQGRIRTAHRVYVMVDYDGTITPIVRHPKLATLGDETRELLRSLANERRCVLAVISGRRLSDIKNGVGILKAYYVGNHGLEIRGPGIDFVHPKAKTLSTILPSIRRELRNTIGGIEGVFIENKGFSLSVHYRAAEAIYLPRLEQSVRRAVKGNSALRVSYGKKIIEIRPRLRWNKGTAGRWLIKSLGEGLSVYAGDDYTDEDAFYDLKRGVTILVSKTPVHSHAKYYVRSVHELTRFLSILLNELSDEQESFAI